MKLKKFPLMVFIFIGLVFMLPLSALGVERIICENSNSPRGKLRIDTPSLFLADSYVAFSFTATSMDKSCNFGGDRSSWLAIAAYDGKNNKIVPNRQVEVVQVSDKGGNQAHFVCLAGNCPDDMKRGYMKKTYPKFRVLEFSGTTRCVTIITGPPKC